MRVLVGPWRRLIIYPYDKQFGKDSGCPAEAGCKYNYLKYVPVLMYVLTNQRVSPNKWRSLQRLKTVAEAPPGLHKVRPSSTMWWSMMAS